EFLHQCIGFAGGDVVEIDDLDGAERTDRGLEGSNQVAAELGAERRRQQWVRPGLHYHPPQARAHRLRVESRRLGQGGGGKEKGEESDSEQETPGQLRHGCSVFGKTYGTHMSYT